MYSKKLLTTIFGLCSILVSSNALILNCEYLELYHGLYLGNLYTCRATVFFVEETQYVLDVTHNHELGKNNSDVKGFVLNQKLEFTPRGINEFFPNIESFVMYNASSRELTRESLQGLNNLKRFDFGSNNISVVEPDLFADSPLMEYIYFERNPIRHVAHHVFDKLDHLRALHFYLTNCINTGVGNNTTAVDQLRFRLFVECPPTFQMTETKIVTGVQMENQVDKQIEKAVEPLYEIIHEMEEELVQLDHRIVILEEAGNKPIPKYPNNL